jgi:hypothetical protein
VLAAVATAAWARVFRAEDVELVSRLSLPAPIKRLAIKAITIAARS